MGYLTLIAFLTLGNLTKSLGPRMETFDFFVRRKGTKSHHHMCLEVIFDLILPDLGALWWVF